MAIQGLTALAGSAGASSAGSSGVGAAATSGGMGILSSVINQVANKRKQKRQQYYTVHNMDLAKANSKELMDYENNINRENWALENEREDYLMANSKRIEAQALRDAGFNPALANGTSAGLPTTPDIAPASSSASAPMGASGAPSNIDGSAIASDAISAMKTGAEIKLMEAQAKNLDSQTEGNEQKNFFNNETMWDNIRMTRQEMNQKEAVAKFMNENPELNMAVAKKQAELNENIEMDTALKNAQIDETNVRAYLEKAQTHLSDVQAMALNDENLRYNSENVHWLLNRISQVQHSRLSADEKRDLLVLYGACLDNCSKVSSDYRKGSIEDLLNFHKANYDSALSYEAETGDDAFSDFVGNVIEALAIGGGMRLFGGNKKGFVVEKGNGKPHSTHASEHKASSSQPSKYGKEWDDYLKRQKRKNKGRKD